MKWCHVVGPATWWPGRRSDSCKGSQKHFQIGRPGMVRWGYAVAPTGCRSGEVFVPLSGPIWLWLAWTHFQQIRFVGGRWAHINLQVPIIGLCTIRLDLSASADSMGLRLINVGKGGAVGGSLRLASVERAVWADRGWGDVTALDTRGICDSDSFVSKQNKNKSVLYYINFFKDIIYFFIGKKKKKSNIRDKKNLKS